MQEHLHFTNKNKLLQTIKKQAKKPVFWCRRPLNIKKLLVKCNSLS